MTSAPTILAIVPARGGSKGLPGKNIRPLAGLPLLVHSLRCAARCPEISQCVVSTDSEEIAAVARAHGGKAPFLRPASLAADSTPMIPVLQHALAEMEARDARRYDLILLLDPTSPGRLPDDVAQARRLITDDPRADGVVAVSEPTFNPFWVGVVVRDGLLTPAVPGMARYTRRQDVPRFLRVNGALYLWRRDSLAAAPADWDHGRCMPLEIPESRAMSIDTLFEFELAELMIRHGLVRLPWLEAPT
jgi:CMP-N,N'-diacetyllegionaminic acid synthase